MIVTVPTPLKASLPALISAMCVSALLRVTLNPDDAETDGVRSLAPYVRTMLLTVRLWFCSATFETPMVSVVGPAAR